MSLNLLVINIPDGELAARLAAASQEVYLAQHVGSGTPIPYGWLELYRTERLRRAVLKRLR